MQQTKTTPKELIDSLPEERKADLSKIHTEISKIFSPEEIYVLEGKFWGGSDQEIIGYGRYSYTRSDKKEVEWFIIGLASQENYISVYVSAVEDGKYLLEKYSKDLGKVKSTKSMFSFKKMEDLNLDNFIELVKRSREMMLG